MKRDPKPCPFCGSLPKLRGPRPLEIECSNPDCGYGVMASTSKITLATWNRQNGENK